MDIYNIFLRFSYQAGLLLQNNYIYFFAVLLGVFLGTKVLIWFIEHVVLLFTRKTKTTLDDKIIHAVKNPLLVIVMLFGLELALRPFVTGNAVAESIDKILVSIGILIGVAMINRVFGILVDAWADHFEKISKLEVKHDLLPLVSKVVQVIVVLFGVVFIFSTWGIEVGPIVASLGVAGIILGLAVQDSLSNVFSGISLILDRAYKVGDIIVLSTGESGSVYDIGLRSTKIKSWDNEMLTVPNKLIANAVIKNIKQPDLAIKTTINFGVEYGSDPEKVKKIVAGAIDKLPKISKIEGRETIVRFMGFGASSLDFVAMFWVDDLADKWETHQKVMSTIYSALNKAKIGIPFPIQTVYFHDETKKRSSKK
ncbi:MAG: mechanosensitive ion channel family protein [Candidatus Woesearchaeota archaeon]